MDAEQAIYNAVISKLRNCDVGAAVERHLSNCNLTHYPEMMLRTFQDVMSSYEKPSVMMRPRLFIDGRMWCALYGDNLQAGVAGFGPSPHEAMWDFDVQWCKKLSSKEELLRSKIEEEEKREEAAANSQFGVGA